MSSPGLDSLEGTKSGISRGGKLDNLGGRISCSLGLCSLLTSVLQARTRGCPCTPGAAGMRTSLCRSLRDSRQLSSALSLPSCYQLPRHLSGAPASLAAWANLSQPAIHPPSSCIYRGRSANTELCAGHEHFPRCELGPQEARSVPQGTGGHCILTRGCEVPSSVSRHLSLFLVLLLWLWRE